MSNTISKTEISAQDKLNNGDVSVKAALHAVEDKIFCNGEDQFTLDGISKLPERYTLSSEFEDENEDGYKFVSHVVEQRFLSEKIRGEESPVELGLELLMVLASQDGVNCFDQSNVAEDGSVKYIRSRQAKLRRLLFNNPFLELIESRDDLNNDAKWEQWGKHFQEFNLRRVETNLTLEQLQDPEYYQYSKYVVGVDNFENRKNTKRDAYYVVIFDEDLARLKKSFSGDFSAFVKAVSLLRSWSFFQGGKQWSYSYLFPFGPDCLFYEVAMTQTYQRNYMSGGGMLVFSMLQRAALKDPDKCNWVGKKIRSQFFNSQDALNVIVQALQGTSYDDFQQSFQADRKAGKTKFFTEEAQSDNAKVAIDYHNVYSTDYLPYKEHKVFDQVAQDFANILSVDLDRYELFFNLSYIGMLNLVVYYLEVCQQVNLLNGCKTNIDMIIECNHNRKNSLRRASVATLSSNNALLSESVFIMLKFYMAGLFPQYNEASLLTEKEHALLVNTLVEAFSLGNVFIKEALDFNLFVVDDNNSDERLASYEQLQRTFIDTVIKKGKHFFKLHQSYCSHIGLVNNVGTRNNRYVLNDELIQLLVLSTIDKKQRLMLLDDFLNKLYEKYHFVIGPNQAKSFLTDKEHSAFAPDPSAFEANLKAFKAQLFRLGFLVNLSDTADYIKNPYL